MKRQKTLAALKLMSVELPSSASSSSSSSSDYERCLRLHHRELVHGVEARHIMDYLFQEQLLTLDDLQLIPSFPIQSDRMRCLLTAIYRRFVSSHPEAVFRHFLLSLSEDYSFLEQKFRRTLEELMAERQSTPPGTIRIDDSVVNEAERQENEPNLSEDVTVIEPYGDAIEEPEETLHFPIMESTDLTDSNQVHPISNAVCLLSPSTEYRLENGQSSPSSEQLLKRQTEIVRRLRDSMVDHLPTSKLGVYASVTLGPLSMPPSNLGRKFKSRFHRKLFDFLSCSVNEQDFDRYSLAKVKLSSKADRDPDTMCLILYLDACKSAIQSDFDACRRTIANSLEVAALTSSPNRFNVLNLSVRIWVNLKRRRLGKARSALGDALNVIAQDPVTCAGMTAGWIYVDEAKLLTATSSLRHVDSVRLRAISAMERALDQFSQDDSSDGPYGLNYASVKLASLLLGCDDRLAWVDVVEPTDADLAKADQLLSSVDDSVAGICSILKPLYLVAQADRKFRGGNLRRAVELARDAEDLASRTGLNEEQELANLRSSQYNQLLVKRGPSRPDCISSSSALPTTSSSSEEADEEGTDDDRGGVAKRGRGGGRKCRLKKRKKKKMNWTDSSSGFRRSLFVVDRSRIIIVFLVFCVLFLTVANVLGRDNGSCWGQRTFGPIGPGFGRMARP